MGLCQMEARVGRPILLGLLTLEILPGDPANKKPAFLRGKLLAGLRKSWQKCQIFPREKWWPASGHPSDLAHASAPNIEVSPTQTRVAVKSCGLSFLLLQMIQTRHAP